MRSTELLEMLCDEGDRVRRVERAAVVAWLRASVSPGFADDLYDGVRWRADEIENGEHRREEER